MLADVGTKEDWKAFFQHGYAGGLQDCLVHVDVGDWPAVPDIAEMINGEETVVVISRVVDEGDKFLDMRRVCEC